LDRVLKDRTAVNYGLVACISYLDDKGFGPSLVHRNGVTRARMFQEMGDAAQQTECIRRCIISSSCIDDQLEATLNSPLGNMKGDYCVGQHTLADCVWAGVCQVATNMGKGTAVSSRSAVNTWFAAVQSHPSTSKEAINPFSCLATKADHDGNTMRDVRINTA
jgi:glutathione S-transferase